MANFVFQNLPENYRLVDALSDGTQEMWWRTTKLTDKLALGDRIFLWQAKGGDAQYQGLHAIAEVAALPRILNFAEFDNYWVNDNEKSVKDPHTRLRIVERSSRGYHLRQHQILQSAILSKKGVFSGNQGINFNLAEDEAVELIRLWRQHATVDPDPDDLAPDQSVDTEKIHDETARNQLDRSAARLRSKSLSELKQIIETPPRQREDANRLIKIAGRARDPAVIAYALLRAGGRCEVANCSLPLFERTIGNRYLEVHHIKLLGDGGPDTIDNVACVCPSHHREVHYGREGANIGVDLLALRTNKP